MIYTIYNPKLVKCYFGFKDSVSFTGVVKDNANTIAYYLNGKFHREDGPAIEFASGRKDWYLNGKRHRTDGPAVAYANGDKWWYLNGNFYGVNDDYTNESWMRFIKLELLK